MAKIVSSPAEAVAETNPGSYARIGRCSFKLHKIVIDDEQLSLLTQARKNKDLRFRSQEPQFEISRERLKKWKRAIAQYQYQNGKDFSLKTLSNYLDKPGQWLLAGDKTEKTL